MIGSRCSSPSSPVIAKSANKGCTATKRCYVAAGLGVRYVTSSCITAVSRAESFRSSRRDPESARRAVLPRPARLSPIKSIRPFLLARDLASSAKSSPSSSALASHVCSRDSVRRGSGHSRRERILYRQLSCQRPIHLAQDQSSAGAHAHPPRPFL